MEPWSAPLPKGGNQRRRRSDRRASKFNSPTSNGPLSVVLLTLRTAAGAGAGFFPLGGACKMEEVEESRKRGK